MRTVVKKLEGGLGLSIPESLANKLALDAGREVDPSIEGDRIIVRPVASRTSRLGNLVDQITDENRHAEILDGPPVGREFW